MSSNPPISVEDLKKALVEMAAALAQFNAKYAVIGGMAGAYRSQPRFTKDLDICCDSQWVADARVLVQ
jgi:hypothetical protein